MERVTLDVDAVIKRTAYAVRGRYKNFVELDDLISEGRLHVMDHPGEVAAYTEHEKPSLAAYWLSRDVWKRMDRFARRQRAQALGYEPQDEQFYGVGLIAMMLPFVLTEQPEPPSKPIADVPKSGSDPAHGGDWLIMYLDVQKAWRETVLSDREREVLMLLYLDGDSQESVAALLYIDVRTVQRCQSRALGKLSEALGGKRPGECPYHCECHEAKLRRRP